MSTAESYMGLSPVLPAPTPVLPASFPVLPTSVRRKDCRYGMACAPRVARLHTPSSVAAASRRLPKRSMQATSLAAQSSRSLSRMLRTIRVWAMTAFSFPFFSTTDTEAERGDGAANHWRWCRQMKGEHVHGASPLRSAMLSASTLLVNSSSNIWLLRQATAH